ncbi:hypothetical protein [uncultured Desulfovibrio sp.]|uniref:hypothetical protein n=1 Tax=uncultured Desulfovibrio sp. TaxID=167968 RepID=UPI00260B0D4C|nr:hypothetical protein [uncultured Desulfovibrio sp.]
MKKSLSFLFLFLVLVVALVPCLSWAAEGAVENAATVPGANLAAMLLASLPASWEGWITLVVTLCAAVSAIWPRPRDDAPILWRGLYAVVNALGFNAGRAKNADDAHARAARLG